MDFSDFSFFENNKDPSLYRDDRLIQDLTKEIADVQKRKDDLQKKIRERENKLKVDKENQPVNIGLNNIRFTRRPLIDYGKLVSKNKQNLKDVPWKDIIYGLKDPDAIRKGLGVTSTFNRDRDKNVTFNKSPSKDQDIYITLTIGTNPDQKDIRIDKIGFTLKTEYLRIVSNDNRIIDFVMRNAEDIREAVNILITIKKITSSIIAENSKFVSETIVHWPRLGPANEYASDLFDKNIKKMLKSVTIIDDNEEIKNSLKDSANKILGISSPAPSFKDNTKKRDIFQLRNVLYCDAIIKCRDNNFRDKRIELGLTKEYIELGVRFKDGNSIDVNKYPFVIFVYAPKDEPPPLSLKECTSATFIKSITIGPPKDGKYRNATLVVGSAIETEALKEDFLKKNFKSGIITKKLNLSKYIYLREKQENFNNTYNLHNLLQSLHGNQFLTSDKIVARGGRNELQLKKQTISNNKKSLKSKNNKIIINRSFKDRNKNMMLKRTIKKNIKR